jgi:ribonuclease Z
MQAVFLTHHHADHWLGLPGMLKSFELRDRQAPLTVYGPPGHRGAHARDAHRLRAPALPVRGRRPRGRRRRRYDGYEVTPSTSATAAARSATRSSRSPRPGRFDAELATRLGVGLRPDFGRLQRGEVVNGVHPEPGRRPRAPGRKLVLSGDTAPCEMLQVAAHEADVLVHEATFTDEEHERAMQTGHSTARQAAELAREADVRLLVLTHLSTRYAGGEIRDEARATFERTEVPRDFDSVEVPFPEKGEPELQRYDAERASA